MDAIAEIKIDSLDDNALAVLEQKLGDARVALDRKLIEIRAAKLPDNA